MNASIGLNSKKIASKTAQVYFLMVKSCVGHCLRDILHRARVFVISLPRFGLTFTFKNVAIYVFLCIHTLSNNQEVGQNEKRTEQKAGEGIHKMLVGCYRFMDDRLNEEKIRTQSIEKLDLKT